MAEVTETFASRGVANTGLGLGIAGTALGLLASGMNGSGLGLFGSGSKYVSQETFDKQTEIASLNSKIALLEADKNTESKMIDVYERVSSRILENERSYANDKQNQAVINAQLGSQIAVNSNNINQLMAMTKLYIPSTNVASATTTSTT